MNNISSKNKAIEHVAIIPDGNRRWAIQNGYPKFWGHKYGGENVIDIALELNKCGVKYATFFLFSTENIDRKEEELRYLLVTLRKLCLYSFRRLHDANCKIRFIGCSRIIGGYDLSHITSDIENQTKDNTGLNICLCLNYGSRQDILNAVKKCIDLGISSSELTMSLFREQLLAPDFPDPDILIRTSGEKRISNYLLWQIAYTELFFVDKYWPDFSAQDLSEIIEEYYKRDRRYGL